MNRSAGTAAVPTTRPTHSTHTADSEIQSQAARRGDEPTGGGRVGMVMVLTVWATVNRGRSPLTCVVRVRNWAA
jgi:hypothetical protein